jgi:hypothetical protein
LKTSAASPTTAHQPQQDMTESKKVQYRLTLAIKPSSKAQSNTLALEVLPGTNGLSETMSVF